MANTAHFVQIRFAMFSFLFILSTRIIISITSARIEDQLTPSCFVINCYVSFLFAIIKNNGAYLEIKYSLSLMNYVYGLSTLAIIAAWSVFCEKE